MIKHILVGCSLLAVLGMGSLPAHAQQKPSSPSTPSTSPSTTQQPVSDEELKKFINVARQMPAISQERNTRVAQVLDSAAKEGLSTPRFMEIYRSKQASATNPDSGDKPAPAAKPVTQITKDEEQKYSRAFAQLEQIRADTDTKMKDAVAAEKLEMPRFIQLLEAIQKTPDLQKRVEQMLQPGSPKK